MLHTINRFFYIITFEFYQNTRITLAVVIIFINYRQSGCGSDSSICGKQLLNRTGSRGDVILAEPRTSVLGVAWVFR